MKKNNEIVTKKSRLQLLALPIFVAGLWCIFHYILALSPDHMTSDCTDSLQWGYQTLLSGKLTSDNFYYAAVIPFGGNLIFLPWLAFFGYTLTAQLGGLCTYALLFSLSIYYLFRSLDHSPIKSAFASAITMILLSGSSKLREIMWEHIFYYNLGLLFLCFGMGLVFRILSFKKPLYRQPLRLIVLALFAFCTATDGLMSLILFTVPCLGALFLDGLVNKEEKYKLWTSSNQKTLLTLFVIAIFSAVGFFLIDKVNGGVEAGYENAYSSWSDMSAWQENLLSFFDDWFSLFGVSVSGGDPFVSLDSIFNAFAIIGSIALLLVPLLALPFAFKMEKKARIFLFAHHILALLLLFAYIFGKLSAANWRLTPLLGSCILCSLVVIYQWMKDKIGIRFGVLLLCFLLLISVQPFKTLTAKADDTENIYQIVAQALEEKDLHYGYANFWFAEVITMMSDDVWVANIRESKSEPQAYRYQIAKDAFDDKDTDSYFLLLTEAENTRMEIWLSSSDYVDAFTIDAEYNIRGHKGSVFYVYVFDYNILNK